MTAEKPTAAQEWPPGVATTLNELAQLRRAGERLNLSGASKVGTLLAGAHRSHFRGRGIEFSEVREYHPGDDIRSIDWRVTARTGKVHTKLFHEERERPVLFLVDLSMSMKFGTRNAFKSVLAARLAAMMGFAALATGDRVGGVVLADSSVDMFRAMRSRRRWLAMLDRIALKTTPKRDPSSGRATPATPAANSPRPKAPAQAHDIGTAMRRMLSLSNPGCRTIVLSDFYQPGPNFQTAFRLLARRTDLQLIHVQDPLEQQAPPRGHYRISDGKNIAKLHAEESRLRKNWSEALSQRTLQLTEMCAAHDATYLAACTQDSPSTILTSIPTSFTRKS